MIKRILMQMRGSTETPPGAGQSSAPMMNAPGLDQAYAQSPSPAMQQNQMPMPLQFNPQLEAQAQGSNNDVTPIVQQIMKHLGMMGMIRNRSNQQMIDPQNQG